MSEIVPGLPQTDPALLEVFGRVARSGPPETFVMFVKSMAEWFSVSVYCPQPEHFVALFDIITERKQAEAALEDRARQLRFVLEGAELGFWDWEIATGKVERNPQWGHMLGYTFDELQHTAQQWSDFVHPNDRERAWASIFDVVEGRSKAHKLEYRMLHKDGSIRWILDQAKVMQRDENGKATRMCGTHTDITERKLLEEELLRQAHVDYLTGVFNRRHFMERAEHELSRADLSNRVGQIGAERDVGKAHRETQVIPLFLLKRARYSGACDVCVSSLHPALAAAAWRHGRRRRGS